ncbi:hypothetical protein BJY04DRAFT_224677 [Aspergillus karnatakaensis]|uniref:uncharacterized protein n=1 Tax=Aspergillus karnatakaensis TaxID=1810916 RepID=UPI003CCD55B8
MTPARTPSSRKKRKSTDQTDQSLDYLNGLSGSSTANNRQTQSANPPRKRRNLTRAPRRDIFEIPIAPEPQPSTASNSSPRRSTRLQYHAELPRSPLRQLQRTDHSIMKPRKDTAEEEEEEPRLPSHPADYEPDDENVDTGFQGLLDLFESDNVHRSPSSRSATPSAALRQDLKHAEQYVSASSPIKRKSPMLDPQNRTKNRRTRHTLSGGHTWGLNTDEQPFVVINKGRDIVHETPPSRERSTRGHPAPSHAAETVEDVELVEGHYMTSSNHGHGGHDDGESVRESANPPSSDSDLFVRQNLSPELEAPSRQHKQTPGTSAPQPVDTTPSKANRTTVASQSSDSVEPDEERVFAEAKSSESRQVRGNQSARPSKPSPRRPYGDAERPESSRAYRTRGIKNRRSRVVIGYSTRGGGESSRQASEPERGDSGLEEDRTRVPGREASQHNEEVSEYNGDDLENGGQSEAEETAQKPLGARDMGLESQPIEVKAISSRHKQAMKFGVQQRNWEALIDKERDIRRFSAKSSCVDDDFRDAIDTVLFLKGWYEDLGRRSRSSGRLPSNEAQERLKVLDGIHLDGDNFLEDVSISIKYGTAASRQRGRKRTKGFEANIIPSLIQLVFVIFDTYHSNSRRFHAIYGHLYRALEVLHWFCSRVRSLSMENSIRYESRVRQLVNPLAELVRAAKRGDLERPPAESYDEDDVPEPSNDRRGDLQFENRQPWSNIEGAALFAGLSRHQGPDRFALILRNFPQLKRRTIQELRETAQEKGEQVLNNPTVQDELATPEGRDKWKYLLILRDDRR